MGLRALIVATLALSLALMGLLATQVLQRQLVAEAGISDRTAAHKDFQRLLLAMEHELKQLDIVLGSWANYTSFYEHAAKPSPVFRRDELSADALRAANFDWLMLVDRQGRIVELSEVPYPSAPHPIADVIRDPAWAKAKEAALNWFRTGGHDCHLFGVEQRVTLVCFRPLHTTDGKGAARGTVAIGRWLQQSLLDEIANETGLSFSFHALPLQHGARTENRSPPFKLRDDRLDVTVADTAVSVKMTLTGMHGGNAAEVEMHWPRESLQRLAQSKRATRLVIALLIVAAGVVMYLVVDRRLVHRLRSMSRGLRRIIDLSDWKRRVPSTGSDEIGQLGDSVNRMLGVIEEKLGELEELSHTDTLTGLANRRRFDAQLDGVVRQFRRDARGGALAVFDVDHFKRYNDRYGHPAGDAVLVEVAACLAEAIGRPVDLAARLGGEEFALLLPLTDSTGARVCIERALDALRAKALTHEGNPERGIVTISCGVALLETGDDEKTLYARADAALYMAKQGGRDRVFEAPPNAV